MDDDLRVLAVLLDKPGPSGEVFDTGRRRLLNEIRGQVPRPAPVLGSGQRAPRRRAGWVAGVAVLAAATSRAIRARGRPALAGGLAAAAAAAAAAVLVLTSGPGALPGQQATAGHARTVVTAAWTVREDSDGTVTITMRQYANPAGLQRTLRADGINAIVRRVPWQTALPGRKPGPRTPLRTFTGCYYATTNNAPPKVQRTVVTIVTQVRQEPGGGTMRAATFIIHPHAMPHGSALFLPYGTNTLPATMKGSRDPGKPAPVYPYPHVKPFDPVVLNNDTVPACVPFTKPGSTPAPPAK
jgi:hypothetical protein